MTHHQTQQAIESRAADKAQGRKLACLPWAEVAAEYRALKLLPQSVHGVHQTATWVGHWAQFVNPDIFVLCVHDQGRLVFALPFEVVKCRTTWIGRFPGGVHANACFPLMDRFATPPSNSEIRQLKSLAKKSCPKLKALIFERQLDALEGVKNPLPAQNIRSRSPNLSLSASLEGGFEGVLSRVSGKKRMKRHRQQGRKLEEFGPVVFVVHDQPQQIEETLDLYLECKAKQLHSLGAPNMFAGEKMRSFMLNNYLSSAREKAAGGKQRFALQSLFVGGINRAVMGTCLDRDGIHIEILTHRQDETEAYSVGEYLICESIQDACERGLAFYDLGLGDQRYKRSWCRDETWHSDVILPLSPYGYYLARYHQFKNGFKGFIKDNPELWALASKIRSKIGPMLGR